MTEEEERDRGERERGRMAWTGEGEKGGREREIRGREGGRVRERGRTEGWGGLRDGEDKEKRE